MSETLLWCVFFNWPALCHFLFTPEMTVFITSLIPTGAAQFPQTFCSIVCVFCLWGSCAQCVRSVMCIVIIWKCVSRHREENTIAAVCPADIYSIMWFCYNNVLIIIHACKFVTVISKEWFMIQLAEQRIVPMTAHKLGKALCLY